MSKRAKEIGSDWSLGEHSVAVVIIAILAILGGIFFIVDPLLDRPVERDRAVREQGLFEAYETGRNYSAIRFADGTVHEIYPHTEPAELRERLETMEAGTPMELWVNPDSGYVAEVIANGEVLLEFESSQQEIYTYGYGYVAIGVFLCASAMFLLCYTGIELRHKRADRVRMDETAKRVYDNGDSIPLRAVQPAAKQRILLEASLEGYRICYRRVGRVNELIVNGRVYDEMRALVEFEHALCAVLDGHEIEAGLDHDSNSYILFDGEPLAQKKRLI